MADGVEVGRAYVTVLPNATGFASGLTSSIVPGTAGVGTTVGKGMGSNMLAAFKKYGAALAGVVSVALLIKGAKSSVDAFVTLNAEVKGLQRTTGGTVPQVSALKAAIQLSGVDSAKSAASLKIFSKNISAAAATSSKLGAAQDTLGVTLKTAEGKTVGAKTAIADMVAKINGAHGSVSKLSEYQSVLGGKLLDANGKFVGQTKAVQVATAAYYKLTSETDKAAVYNQLLGNSWKDATGKVKPLTELLPQLSEKFSKMKDGPDKTALAMKLFGRAGADMLPFLNKGASGIEELKAKAGDLGLVLDDGAQKKFGEYKVAARTLDASMQGLAVSVGGAIIPVFTGISTMLTETAGPAIKKVIDYISNSSEIKGIVDGIFGTLVGLGKTLGPVLADVGGGILTVTSGLLKWAAPMTENKALMLSIVGALVAWKAVGIAQSIISTVTALAKGTVALVTHTAAAIADKAETLALYAMYGVEAVKSAAITVAQAAKQVGAWLLLKGAQIASAVATGAVTAAQWLLNAAMSANPIGLIILAVVALVGAFIYLWNTNKGFRDFFIGAWAGIQAAAKAVADWFSGTLAPAISAVWNKIVTFVTGIPARFMAGLAAIGKIAGAIGTWVMNARNAAVDKFLSLVTWVAGLPGRILSALGGLATVLLNRGKDLVDGLRDGIVNRWDSLKNWLGDLPGKLVSAVGGLTSKLSSAGHDLVEGLWNGISNGYGWIKGKIESWVGNVVDFIKKLFGVKSPSTVMRDEVGKWLPAGIGVGIEDNADAALNPMQSLASSLTSAAQASVPTALAPYAATGKANGDQWTIYEATDAAAVAAEVARRQLVMRG